MKKIVALCIALVLTLTAVSAFAANPSKSGQDYPQIKTNKKGPVILAVNEPTLGEDLSMYQERIDIAEAEIDKMAVASPIESYFGNTNVDLLDKLNVSEVNVFEYCPVIASGWKKADGDVTAKFLFATPYEVGEQVVVMLGEVIRQKSGDYTIDWNGYDGVGIETKVEADYGTIESILPIDVVLGIQNGIYMLAIVSK